MVEHAVALYVTAVYVTEITAITSIFGPRSTKESGVAAGGQWVEKEWCVRRRVFSVHRLHHWCFKTYVVVEGLTIMRERSALTLCLTTWSRKRFSLNQLWWCCLIYTVWQCLGCSSLLTVGKAFCWMFISAVGMNADWWVDDYLPAFFVVVVASSRALGWQCQSVNHLGPDLNILYTIGWIVIFYRLMTMNLVSPASLLLTSEISRHLRGELSFSPHGGL